MFKIPGTEEGAKFACRDLGGVEREMKRQKKKKKKARCDTLGVIVNDSSRSRQRV